MGDVEHEHLDLSAVPLFPLPNVVLFPRAVLPLHIFEERYKQMTADALAGDRQVAMALLRPGWEKSYYGRPAIEPVACVGTIVRHEKLPDGKYNFLLQGHTRARVAREHPPGHFTYRLAKLEPILETPVLEIDLGHQRERLTYLFTDGPLAHCCLARQFRQMLRGTLAGAPTLAGPLPTAHVADLIAFNLLEDIEQKQRLLAEPDVRERVDVTLRLIEKLAPQLAPVGGGPSAASRSEFAPGDPDWN